MARLLTIVGGNVAETSSMMQALGTEAPAFSLPDPSGRVYTLDEFRDGRALLVMFICNHCPFVQHVQAELVRLVAEYQARGARAVAVNSNDVSRYPDDSPARMRDVQEHLGYTFPYLFDASQQVAKSYGAVCTPDFFLYDQALRLAYRGQMDGSRPTNGVPNDGADLRRALDAVLAGQTVPGTQVPSIGCGIKWKPGNEPVDP